MEILLRKVSCKLSYEDFFWIERLSLYVNDEGLRTAIVSSSFLRPLELWNSYHGYISSQNNEKSYQSHVSLYISKTQN